MEKSVQTLDRALDIIELLSVEREGVGVTEISQRVALHKSTVHRLLNALACRGYVEKDEKFGTYKLGLKFVEISSLFLNKLELKTEAFPYLRRLAEQVGQPVHMAILGGKDAVYIDKVETLSSIRMYSQIGKRVPLYCTAIGKILLSGLDDGKIQDMLREMTLCKYTDNTITSLDELLKQVHEAREKGCAVDNEEHEAGIRCIAAPVLDYTGRIIAAVSVSGDSRVVSQDRDEEISRCVKETAEAVSKRMGYISRESV